MKKYLVLLLFYAHGCYADGASYPLPDYMKLHKPYLSKSCANTETQYEMDECTQKSLSATTKQMVKILTKLRDNYKANEPNLVAALNKSQSSWESIKTTSCEFETYYSREGSGYASILNACLESKINERISYLQWMLDHP